MTAPAGTPFAGALVPGETRSGTYNAAFQAYRDVQALHLRLVRLRTQLRDRGAAYPRLTRLVDKAERAQGHLDDIVTALDALGWRP